MQNRSFIKIFSHGQITDLTNGFTFEKSLVFSIFAVPKSSSSPDVFTLNARLVGDTVASAVPIAVNRWNHVAIVEIQPDTQLLSQYDLYWGGSEDDYGQGGQPVPPTPPVPTPKTIIKYSTSDGQPVALTAPERFVDASGTPVPILYNTVNEDGHGELAFDGFVDCINGATFTNSRLACIHLPEEITSLGLSLIHI